MAQSKHALLSWFVRIVVAILIVGGGLFVFIMLRMTKPEPKRVDQSANVPRVLVMPARAVEVRRQWEGFGTARAMNAADIPARITATVVEVPDEIVDGARVERGAVIALLDETDFQQQVQIAQDSIADLGAQLDRLSIEETSWRERLRLIDERIALARADLERVRDALARDAARQREVDIAQQALIDVSREQTATREELEKIPARRASLSAQRRRFQTQLEQAQENLDRTRITSPIDGVIQEVDVDLGENVTAGQRVARVVDLRTIEIPLQLPAAARSHIQIGDRAKLYVERERAAPIEATVIRIAPEEDASTRTMRIYLVVEQELDSPIALAPGRFVRGVVTSGQPESRYVVPRRAVDGDQILLVENGLVIRRDIQPAYNIAGTFPALGISDMDWVVLADPLDPRDAVILNPTRTLATGRAVEPVVPAMEEPRTASDGRGER